MTTIKDVQFVCFLAILTIVTTIRVYNLGMYGAVIPTGIAALISILGIPYTYQQWVSHNTFRSRNQ